MVRVILDSVRISILHKENNYRCGAIKFHVKLSGEYMCLVNSWFVYLH